MTFLREWVRHWVDLIRHPAEFFRALRDRLEPVQGLTFGLACHWIGQAGTYFIKPWFSLEDWLGSQSDWTLSMEGLGLPIDHWIRVWEFFVSPARVLLDPFFQLVSLGWTALFIWIGTFWLLRGRHPKTRFLEVLGLLGWAQAPQVILAFTAFAPLASFVVSIYSVVVGVIGFKAYFGVPTHRAMAIYFFPALVAWTGILMVVALGLVLILPFLW